MKVADQINDILFYFFYSEDDDITESEVADLELFASNLAETLLVSMSFDVTSVEKDGTINAKLSLQDVSQFIAQLSESTLLGE